MENAEKINGLAAIDWRCPRCKSLTVEELPQPYPPPINKVAYYKCLNCLFTYGIDLESNE